MQGHNHKTVILMPVFIAKPGLRGDLARELEKLQALSRRDEGCIAYSVFADLEEPDRFLLYEEWTTEEALADHNERTHVCEFLALTADWLVSPFHVTRLRPIGDYLSLDPPTFLGEGGSRAW